MIQCRFVFTVATNPTLADETLNNEYQPKWGLNLVELLLTIVHPFILKHCAHEIALLKVIYTQSLSSINLPANWLSPLSLHAVFEIRM